MPIFNNRVALNPSELAYRSVQAPSCLASGGVLKYRSLQDRVEGVESVDIVSECTSVRRLVSIVGSAPNP